MIEYKTGKAFALKDYTNRAERLVEQILEDVSGILEGKSINLNEIRKSLSELKSAGEEYDFSSVTDLCCQMEQRLFTAFAENDPGCFKEILAGCRYIQLHTRSLTKGLRPPDIAVTLVRPSRGDHGIVQKEVVFYASTR